MPVKAQLANGARHAARRRFYFVAANSPAHQFFDAGFTPISPRLVNTAQVTLQQGPSSGSSGPSAQQSKGAQSSSTQPPTSTLVLPLPLGGATPGSGASGRANTGSTHNGATGGMHIPTTGNFATPSFFPSILGSSEKSQSRSTFRLESGAYGIPKMRSTPSKRTSSPPASSSSSSTPSTSSSPLIAANPLPPPLPESLDLSCQIGDDAYFVRSVGVFPHSIDL